MQENSVKNKAVFLDKDGTLIPDIPYNVDVDKISFSKGAAEGLILLRDAGYRLVIVTNQSGVAKGYFDEYAIEQVARKLEEMMAAYDIKLDGFYFCPHLVDAPVQQYAKACLCRKPQPGLLFQSAKELNIDLAASWMVGDILNDVEAGNRAGCKTVLLDNGGETEWVLSSVRTADYTVPDFFEAARKIVSHNNKEKTKYERVAPLP